MEEKKSKKRGRGRAIAGAVLALILVAAAVLALLFREKLSPSYLSDVFSSEESVTDENAEPFTYEVGSGQVFAVSDNNLAVASSTGIQLLDSKGKTIAYEVFSMETPAITASEVCSVFYDIGGTALRVVDDDGEVTPLEQEKSILTAHMSSSGHLTVITEETGYKAAVTVYNEKLERVYAWHSGSAYVLSAQVSPAGNMLAAVCVDASGGKLMLFSLSKEEAIGSYEVPNELFLDLAWMGRDRICLLSESRLVFLDTEAQQTGEYSFGGQYLLDYDLAGGDYAALLLSEYRTGGSSRLVTVDRNGEGKGQRSVEQRDVLSISAGNDVLLVLYSDALELVTETLSPVNSTTEILGVKKALLRRDGKCLLLSAYAAELIDLY